jgi:hypothetical protein
MQYCDCSLLSVASSQVGVDLSLHSTSACTGKVTGAGIICVGDSCCSSCW